MAGKSSKGKNRRGNSTTTTGSSAEVVAASSGAPLNESSGDPLNDLSIPEAATVDADENVSGVEPVAAEGEVKEPEVPNQGGVHLYPVSVKALGGEKLELQLNPGDSVLDIRQFLLDAPETCFITCYDLLLQTKDGSIHHLEDHYEISEVADITTGGCSLEMVAELYDDRAIRAHVNRTRNLLSLSSLHASLSTSLALQFTTEQKKASTAGDTAKTDSPCLDGLGFMEDVTASLSNLISSTSEEIKSVESIVFSSFNPPPSYRRLVGDLIYLDVVTLEGNIYCITGTTKTFYVNSSHGNILDPKPNKATPDATTLIGLLQKLSPMFKKAFRDILDGKAAAHPFENVQSLLPPNKWLGRHPVPDHKRDAARAEDALTLSYGSELIGMQRDWNEELQSCREFPHTTPQERILRDRALYKVTSDFVDAAINGATGVINRCIPPINPTDPECFHMYVHNNIFFSFAVDSDLEQLSKKRLHNSETESASSLQSSSEKASNEIKSDGTVAGDSDVAAETQLVDSEQATYASANNDLKGTKSYQEADVSGLYNLAMAIIDYRGHRVVAQSVLPGILQGDKSDSLLYGSVDNGKKICWNEDFHSKVLEAAKRLHLKEHMVLDGSGNSFKLAAPVECKGIVGSDDRHYLLDLMRVTPRDANYTGPGSRFYILRSELITAYCQAKSLEGSTCCTNGGDSHVSPNEVSNNDEAEKTEAAASASSNCEDTTSESKAETTPESVSEPAECPESQKELLFNPNVFTDFKLAGSPEDIAADEENVRKVSSYLINVVLPKFIQDLCTLEVSPMDGQTFTEALHAHGINVRYIGKVAEGTKHLPHLWDLCTNEIVVRCAKHILKDVLRETEDHELAPSIAHFLNCFFGSYQVTGARVSANSSQSRTHKKQDRQSPGKSSKGQTKLKGGASARKGLSSFMNISSETLWCNIQEFAKLKYQFELPDDARPRVKKVSVMRNLCQKVGITIAARKYDLDAAAPFQTSDILDLQPVVKHSVPVCSEAKDLVETGKAQLAEGMLGEAYTLFSEAFSILQQVTGPMHREVANCCRYLAMVLYHAGDMESAIIQQHKELIINERCLGLDHPDTAHSYGNMSLFYHGLNQTELALQHMSRALLLLSLSSGPDHPDVAATYINVAMMYQDIGKMDTALRYLQEALTKNERLLGEEHIQTAVCYHALAIAFNCMGAFKLSHQHEKKTYDILVKQLGEEDSRTRDSENWMKTFKKREEQMIAQKQKGQVVNSAPAQNPLELLKAHPNLMQALQAVAGRSSASVNKSLNAAIIGEALPRGRGVDERAARATADARKKATGRGYVKPQPDVPVQPLSQINQQILNMVSGMTPDAVGNKEANGHSSNSNGTTAAAAVKKEPQAASGQDQPAGLGKGLGSLVSKKHKGKPKVAG